MCGQGQHHHGQHGKCGCHEGRHGAHHEGCECDCHQERVRKCGCHEGRPAEGLKDLQTEAKGVEERLPAVKAVSA